MLISGLNKTLTTLLSGPAAAQPPAVVTPEKTNTLPEKDSGGVIFDLSEQALAANSPAAQTPDAVVTQTANTVATPPAATAAPATEPTTAAPTPTTTDAAETAPAKTGRTGYTAAPVAEDRPVTNAPVQEEVAEADPSEEARARAHAEDQLATSRLRNLAISTYQDSQKLFSVIDANTKAADTKAEAAPLHQALKAA